MYGSLFTKENWDSILKDRIPENLSVVDQERVELVSAGRREFRNIKDGLTHYLSIRAFLFSLVHSLCSSGKDFEVSSSSRDSALSGASGFGGICTGFSGMCGSLDRFRQRMKLDIADRDIVIPFPARSLWICLSVARSRYHAARISC